MSIKSNQYTDISDDVIEQSEYLKGLCRYGIVELKPSFYNPITQEVTGGESHCQDVTNFSIEHVEDMVKSVLNDLDIKLPIFYSLPTLDRINTKGLPIYVFKNTDKYHLQMYVGGV